MAHWVGGQGGPQAPRAGGSPPCRVGTGKPEVSSGHRPSRTTTLAVGVSEGGEGHPEPTWPGPSPLTPRHLRDTDLGCTADGGWQARGCQPSGDILGLGGLWTSGGHRAPGADHTSSMTTGGVAPSSQKGRPRVGAMARCSWAAGGQSHVPSPGGQLSLPLHLESDAQAIHLTLPPSQQPGPAWAASGGPARGARGRRLLSVSRIRLA